MDLVYECFVKLGLRYICVLRDGKYAGMVGLFLYLTLHAAVTKLTYKRHTRRPSSSI